MELPASAPRGCCVSFLTAGRPAHSQPTTLKSSAIAVEAGSSNNRDEVLVCEGDLIGKSREQSRSLYFWRDRAWLQS